MFYDRKGNKIREGSIVNFYNESCVIVKINGNNFGKDGCSTLLLDNQNHTNIIPDESNVLLLEY